MGDEGKEGAGAATALHSREPGRGRRKFVGIDFDPDMIRMAQSRIAQALETTRT
jgi:hypothetical protein